MKKLVASFAATFIYTPFVFSQVILQEIITFKPPVDDQNNICTVKTLQNLQFGNITQGSTRSISTTTGSVLVDEHSIDSNVSRGIVKIQCPTQPTNKKHSFRIINRSNPNLTDIYTASCELLSLEISQSFTDDASNSTPITFLENSTNCEKVWHVNPDNGDYLHIGGTLTIPSTMPIKQINSYLIIESYQ